MYVCLCLCLSLYEREVTVGYARLRGGMGMGATFCHLAALRSAKEFLFWDHWKTAVLGQILAGRSREVRGANFCHLAALRLWRTLPRHFSAEPKRFWLGAGFRPPFSGYIYIYNFIYIYYIFQHCTLLRFTCLSCMQLQLRVLLGVLTQREIRATIRRVIFSHIKPIVASA